MKKFAALRILNVILFLSVLLQAGTGILHPLGLVGHEFFEKVHPLNGILLALLIVIHLALNFTWIVQNYFKRA